MQLPEKLLPAVPASSSIPKLIHQTFHTKALPPELQRNVESIRAANPDWQYTLYDDEDIEAFILANYGTRILDLYHRINPKYGAARADLFRYLLMYRLGGVYLDIKSYLTKPLSELVDPGDQYWLSHWKNKPGERHAGWGIWPDIPDSVSGEFQQWFLVAAPGHPFLRAVLERVLHNIATYDPYLHGRGRLGVFRVTGPIAYTLAILPHMHNCPHRLIDCHQTAGFEYSIYQHIDDYGHRQVFPAHYSEMDDAIVMLDPLRQLHLAAMHPTKAARRAIRILLQRLSPSMLQRLSAYRK